MNATTLETPTLDTAEAVRAAFALQRAAGLRAKDAAQAMGWSEGAVVQAHAGTHDAPMQVTPLRRGEWLQVLQALEPCGCVMALTRNESVVHEKEGVYRGLSQEGHVALCVNPDIDLRLFFMHWHAGYAVREPGRSDVPLHSLQFFDAHGVAVHKVYARPATDMQAWHALVARFAQQDAQSTFAPAAPRTPVSAQSPVNAEALRQAWAQMQDTHAFFGLLKKFACERQQSFRLVQGTFTEALSLHAVTDLLERAAAAQTPIMVFVGSKGCIQIHTGPVQRIKAMEMENGQWLNVLDDGFNLHLRSDHIHNIWLVRKPTADGVVTSVEVFDAHGECVAMFFGARKPGNPELPAWRALAESLERQA